MSPEFSAATSKTRRRLEVFADLWFEERPTRLPHLRLLSNVMGSRTKRAPGGADFRSRRRTLRVASSGARAGCHSVTNGAIAQLGERLNGIQEVRGSTPLGSTNSSPVTYYIVSRLTSAHEMLAFTPMRRSVPVRFLLKSPADLLPWAGGACDRDRLALPLYNLRFDTTEIWSNVSISPSATSTTRRSAAVSGGCGGTGSPTS